MNKPADKLPAANPTPAGTPKPSRVELARPPQTVNGWCPMGCGRTLELDARGRVRCLAPACPRRFAVDDILDYPEHEHLVAFAAGSFTTMHPLRERATPADLLTCTLAEFVVEMGETRTFAPGIYRADQVTITLHDASEGTLRRADGTWFLTEVARDRWPVPEEHTCSRCGDRYTGLWRNHLRDDCSSTDRSDPDDITEPIEPLLDPSTKKSRR